MNMTNRSLHRSARWLLAALVCWLGAASSLRAAEPPPLEVYGRLPSMEHVALSDSGMRLAYIAVIGEQRKLVAQVLGAKPEALGIWPLGDVKLRSVQWAGDDYVVVTLSQTVDMGWTYGYEHELSQVLAINVNDRTVKPLLGRGKTFGASFGCYGFRQIDGQWYGYFRAMSFSNGVLDNVVLAKVNLKDQHVQYLAHGSSQQSYPDWLIGSGGEVLATSRYQDARGDWRLVGGIGNGREIASGKDLIGGNDILGQGRTPGTLLYKLVDQQNQAHFLEAPLQPAQGQSAAPVEILADVATEGLVFDPATHLLIGYRAQGDEQELVMFDARLKGRVLGTRKAFPGLHLRFEGWNRDIDRFIVRTEGAQDAGTYWLVDIHTGQASLIGGAYEQIPREQINSGEMFAYKASDGLQLYGVLTLPPGHEPKQLPLVVMPHGGPEARDYPGFDWWAQAYVSRGYAVWQPNFRGSSGYSDALLQAGYGQIGRRMQTDISDGTAELARRGIVDAKRACIVGASYGGYAALAGVTLQQGLYRCAVSVAGLSDLNLMLRDSDERYRNNVLRYWARFFGVSGSYDSGLKPLSPVNLAAQADAPILLIHGRDDTVVPIEQSKNMRKALQRADKPVDYVELEGEDHWLSREQTRLAMLKAAVEFVQRHNPADQ